MTRIAFRRFTSVLIFFALLLVGVNDIACASCATPNTTVTRYVDCARTSNGDGLSWATAWNKIRTAAQSVGNGTKVLVKGSCSEVQDIRIQGNDIWFQVDQPVTIKKSGSPHDGVRIVAPPTRVMIDGKNSSTKFSLQGTPGRFNEGVVITRDEGIRSEPAHVLGYEIAALEAEIQSALAACPPRRRF